MAIIKIIPIKQSRGIQDCKDYISDEEKVISVKKSASDPLSIRNSAEMDSDEEEIAITSMDFHTVLAYMKNDEKTHRTDEISKKYISGYMCNPETAVQEFLNAKEQNLFRQGKTLNEETGNWAYHLIQSFPENLDISDDEIHQCGRELCEKLGLYQAVICSHIHPVINEEGEVSGRCKHNHILINSHMHPDKLDPEKPNVFKYNNCRETYVELQKWNDEISLDHGLPIIRNPDLDRRYSWFKSQKENEDASWTKQVAVDIKNTMRFCSNWEEFKKQMTEQGYFIREAGKTITYYTPEHTETHKQQIREKRLGREYTKAEMERYWSAMGKLRTETRKTQSNDSKANLIKYLIKQYDTNLFAEVKTKSKRTYTLDIPLKNPRRQVSEQILKTYFEEDKTYNLCTSDHIPIAQVTGRDIFEYYEQLRREREKQKKKEEKQPDRQEYYYEKTKINYQTQRPYKIRLWDENGRRRSNIELICILAMVVIKKEHPYASPQPTFRYQGDDGQLMYAKTDWKLQNMYNTIAMANEMKVEDSQDVKKKLDRAGKEVARKRKQIKLLNEQLNQMDLIEENIAIMESVREVCQQIYDMPDGEEKEAAIENHAAELDQYTASKRYLHMKGINTEADITDFRTRYASMMEHVKEVESDLQSINEEYRKLKRIDYNLALTQNDYYCYGPNHPRFQEEQQKQEEEKKEEQTAEQQNINKA